MTQVDVPHGGLFLKHIVHTKSFGFAIFRFDLFQKRGMRTKFDIYFFVVSGLL